MAQSPEQLLRGLRAVADGSRLRLLSLLARGEFAVTELTEVLGQSQPRVSRHLKLMTEAGLLERFRELHWVYYRLAADGDGAELARTLLGLLDRDDPLVALDRERAAELLARRAGVDGTSTTTLQAALSSDGDELAQIADAELEGQGFDSLLYAGPAPTVMLRVLGPRARRVVGLSDSRPEVQRARASLHGAGLAHCVLQQGDLPAVAAMATTFDVVVLDRVLGSRARPDQALADVARVLRPAGRLVLIEDYDALAARAATDNPLALLRDWLARGGLQCARMRPVDTGRGHLLVATAAAESGRAAA
jgi:DNA-binding transcriptional ArsR family regulator